MEAGDEQSVQQIIEALDPDERAGVFALWAEELRRGCVPKRIDLESALHVLRTGQP